jgi:hypothetical protein
MPVSDLVAISPPGEGIGKDDLAKYPLIVSNDEGSVAVQVQKARTEEVLGPGGWPAVMPMLGDVWYLSFNETLVRAARADVLKTAFTVAAWASAPAAWKAALATDPHRSHLVPVLFSYDGRQGAYLAELAPPGFEDSLANKTASEKGLEEALAAEGRPGRVGFDMNSGYFYVMRGTPAVSVSLWGGRYTSEAYAREMDAMVPGGALARCSPETVIGIGALPLRAYFLAEECLRRGGFATPPAARTDDTEAESIKLLELRQVAEADNWRAFIEAGGFSAETVTAWRAMLNDLPRTPISGTTIEMRRAAALKASNQRAEMFRLFEGEAPKGAAFVPSRIQDACGLDLSPIGHVYTEAP